MLVLASLSGKSTHDPPHGVVGRPVILMFLSLVLVFAIVICFVGCPVIIVVGSRCWGCCRRVLVFIFFIAVYFVGGLNDLM